MDRLNSHHFLVLTLGSLHFKKGTKSGNFENHPTYTVSRKLLETFGANLSLALKDKREIGIEFPTEMNRSDWSKCFTHQEDDTFVCKKSRLNIIWNDYRPFFLLYPMGLIHRVLYNSLCQVNGYAETDYDEF